jgi:hypothetical protein
MIREVQGDVEENGSVSLEDALARMDRAIEEVAGARRIAK